MVQRGQAYEEMTQLLIDAGAKKNASQQAVEYFVLNGMDCAFHSKASVGIFFLLEK